MIKVDYERFQSQLLSSLFMYLNILQNKKRNLDTSNLQKYYRCNKSKLYAQKNGNRGVFIKVVQNRDKYIKVRHKYIKLR